MNQTFIDNVLHSLNELGEISRKFTLTQKRWVQFMVNVIMQVSHRPSETYVQLSAECVGTVLRKRCHEEVFRRMEEGFIWRCCPKCGDMGRIDDWKSTY